MTVSEVALHRDRAPVPLPVPEAKRRAAPKAPRLRRADAAAMERRFRAMPADAAWLRDDWTLSDGTNCGGLFCVPGHGCGKRCPNDNTEEEVGATFSCGGHYCILGLGCKLGCKEYKDCRPGFICDVIGSSKTCTHP